MSAPLLPSLSPQAILAGVALTALLAVETPAPPAQPRVTGASLFASWAATPATHSHIPAIGRAGRRAQAPTPTTVIPVSAHGAKPDDDGDDTAAIRAAIADAERRVRADPALRIAVVLPKGTFAVSDILFIGAPRVWLVGAGSGQTTLAISKALNEVVPMGYKAGDLSTEGRNFSWRGGMVWFGHDPFALPATSPAVSVSGRAAEGATTIQVPVAHAARVAAWIGQPVHLRYRGDDAWRRHVFGHPSASQYDWATWTMIGADGTLRWEYATRITAVDAATGTVTLDEPLRLPIEPAWDVLVGQRSGELTDNGLVGVRIAFPEHKETAHLENFGYNGVFFSVANEGLVQDVAIHNAENGVILERTSRSTVRQVTMTGSPMHHAFSLREQCGGNLIQEFTVKAKVHHGLSVQDLSSGNVYTRGVMDHGGIDSHRGMPFDHAVTDVTIRGDGHGGGAASGGPLVGRRMVMWNVRVTIPPIVSQATTPEEAKREQRDMVRRDRRLSALAGQQHSVMGAIIGVHGARPQPESKPWALPPGDKGTLTGDWGVTPAPANLYEAQRAHLTGSGR